jgi:hypothetical protein
MFDFVRCRGARAIVFQSCSNRVPIVFQSCSNRVPIVFQSCSNICRDIYSRHICPDIYVGNPKAVSAVFAEYRRERARTVGPTEAGGFETPPEDSPKAARGARERAGRPHPVVNCS